MSRESGNQNAFETVIDKEDGRRRRRVIFSTEEPEDDEEDKEEENSSDDGDDSKDEGDDVMNSNSEEEKMETTEFQWKENIAQKAADAFVARQNTSANLYRLVYGNGKGS